MDITEATAAETWEEMRARHAREETEHWENCHNPDCTCGA
jgi:hypothetical protein